MPDRYLRLLTHSVIKVDLDNPPQNYKGVASKTPESGGILIIVKSKSNFLCLRTMALVNTDFLIPYFSTFTTDYDITYIFNSELSSTENNLYNDFFDRLESSLINFKLPSFKSEEKLYYSSPMVGIHFDGTYAKLFNFELMDSPPFDAVRIAINFFNFFGAKDSYSKYVDYGLDLQFDNSITQVPKLTEKGYLLWNMLKNKNLLFLHSNPYIHDDVKEMSTYNKNYNQKILDDYSDYVKLIKHQGTKAIQNCVEKFKSEKFREAATYAQIALKIISSINELHVLDEYSLCYYNLGSALLKDKLFSDAHNALEKAKEFSERVENIERLAKIRDKLLIIEENKKPPLFELPWEILLKILNNFSIPDIQSFACTSSYSSHLMRDGLFWQQKLFNDFTKKVLPETKMLYQKQYKEKYKNISKDNTRKSQLLFDSVKTGSEVMFEKLMLEGVRLPENNEAIQKLFETPNIEIIDLAFKYSLNINTFLKTNSSMNASVFHIAIFKKPELLPKLLMMQEEINILPPMHVAVIKNNIGELKKALKDSENIDQEDLCGLTALWWAVSLNRIQMAIFLEEKGADKNKLFKYKTIYYVLQFNILKNIIFQNKKDALELLLRWGLTPNSSFNIEASYKNLLTLAAECGNCDIIRLLQMHGAIDKSNIKDNDIFKLSRDAFAYEEIYLSGFCMAAEKNHVKCLEVFLTTGTKIDDLCTIATFDHKNTYIDHNTALFFAVRCLSENSVEFLLKNRANANIVGINVNYANERCYGKDEKLPINQLCYFLEFHDLNFTQSNYSIQNSYIKSWFKILELLLKHNVDLNKSYFIINLITAKMFFRVRESKNCTAHTPMGNAPSRQNFIITVFELLFKYAADFNLQDTKGNSVLHYAAEQGLFLVVKYLIEKIKININLKNNEGETAIFGAARNLHEDIYKYLNKSGINMQANNKVETPNQIASYTSSMRYK